MCCRRRRSSRCRGQPADHHQLKATACSPSTGSQLHHVPRKLGASSRSASAGRERRHELDLPLEIKNSMSASPGTGIRRQRRNDDEDVEQVWVGQLAVELTEPGLFYATQDVCTHRPVRGGRLHRGNARSTRAASTCAPAQRWELPSSSPLQTLPVQVVDDACSYACSETDLAKLSETDCPGRVSERTWLTPKFANECAAQ